MKKQILLLTLLLSVAASAFAIEAEINGLWYELVSETKEATVIRYRNGVQYSGDIVIPESVEYEGAAYSVTAIGGGAFRSCSSMTSIAIPSSITSIGGGAFFYCGGLTSVQISDIEAWCKIVFNALSNPLTYAHHLFLNGEEIKELVIPGSVTSIGDYTFDGCMSLTSVTIPNSVTNIGKQAFKDCNNMTSVTIPNSVTSIGNSAFCDCNSLTSITIPNSVTNIKDQTFYNCMRLTSVTIGNGVTSIGNDAFNGCGGLTSIMIPNSVTSIGNDAFEFCGSLTSITISSSVTSIGNDAFYHCYGLTSVYISDLEAWCNISFGNEYSNPLLVAHHLFLNEEEITELVIPNRVTSVCSWAFFGCRYLTSVTIGDGVKWIGIEAFAMCKGLTTIVIGSGVKNIFDKAFANCTELTDGYCYAENVPSTNANAFEGSGIEHATLHVPKVSIDAYKAAEPWKNFGNIVALPPRCATPTIAFVDGKLKFSCETEGVEFVSEVTVADAKKNYSSEVSLTGIYKVSVYATKAGYDNSDVATKEFTFGPGGEVCDVNKDGQVDVADIATIIDRMAGKE